MGRTGWDGIAFPVRVACPSIVHEDHDVVVRAKEQHQFQFVFFFAVVILPPLSPLRRRLWSCKVSFTYDDDGRRNRIAKDNDDDEVKEPAFESSARRRFIA